MSGAASKATNLLNLGDGHSGEGQANGFNSPAPVGGAPNVNNIAPNSAHFVSGKLNGANAAYADGHVESHGPSKLKAVYALTGYYWYY